jgi:hypothetical protein
VIDCQAEAEGMSAMKGHATPKVRPAPHAGPLRRKLREFWPDRNPLRRRWDRAEAVVVGGLLVTFVVAGTLAALIAGRWAYEDALSARHAELATFRQVPAVLLTTASEQPAGYYASANAWWRMPDGVRHTGQVSTLAGSPAGTTVKVWVDAAGRLVSPPLQPTQVQGQAVVTAMLAVMAVAAVLWGAGLTAHCMAHRRRMAAWDDEWRAFGPKWSRRG